MIYVPANTGIRTGLFVSSIGKETAATLYASGPTSAAVSTDVAYIARIVLPTATVIRRFYWCNGTTASTNTVQVGIYNDDLSALLRGTATTSSGAAALQFDNVTDTPISAGRYWMALVCTGTTATFRLLSNVDNHANGHYQMAAARPLPSTLVPAQVAAATTLTLPLFGFTSIA